MRTLVFLLFAAAAVPAQIRFVGKTKYLNNAKAAVVHSIDDSTQYVPATVDVMDKYGIKSTIFVSTDHDPAPEDRFFTQLQIRGLWPRLRQAIADGHEIGSHSRQHPCKKPDDETFCAAAYSDYEIVGSRDDILRLTQQPHVWSWCYPCGNCATYSFIQKRIAAAGYLVARNYPNELTNGHIRPDVQDFDENTMNAGYTQVVQHRGMAKNDPIDMAAINAKFDEVYGKGGVYHFMSHPQWLDFGPDAFYESHVRYVGRRCDVWYVPMGPLYAFRTIRDRTSVKPEGSAFTVSNGLDRRIYGGALTLEFEAPAGVSVLSNGRLLAEQGLEMTDRWDREYIRRDGSKLYATVFSNTKLEFLMPSTPGDLTGAWKVSYRTPNGKERETVLELKQSGNQLSGMMSSERGKAPVSEGRVDGNKVSLTVVRVGHGEEIPVAFTGIAADDVLHLTLQFKGGEPMGATGRLFAATGAEPFYFGGWKIESAVVAPWWVEKNPPDPVSVKALTGRTITFAAKSIAAPKILACASPRYAIKEYPADYLFQGGFGEMNRRDRSVDPVKIAASVGFRGSKWKTLETGCDFDFHFIDERTAAFALDNYIYRLKKQ